MNFIQAESNAILTTQDTFMPPTFHLVMAVVLRLILGYKVLDKRAWLVDIVAAGSLLYGTYTRTRILEGRNWANRETAITSDYRAVTNYFVLSVTSWIALFILEGKTCIQMFGTVFGKFRYPVNVPQVVKFFVCFLLASNSVLVILHFCTDVHQTFEHLTSETPLILYYWIAAFTKVASVFIQGVYFCSWITNHPVCFIPNDNVREQKLMFRMTFVNVIGLCHSLGLVYFSVLNSSSPWTLSKMCRTIFFVIDLMYKLFVCWWYLKNSYCCLGPWFRGACSTQTGLSRTVIVSTIQHLLAKAHTWYLVLVNVATISLQCLFAVFQWVKPFFGIQHCETERRAVQASALPQNDQMVLIYSKSPYLPITLKAVDVSVLSVLVYLPRRCILKRTDDHQGGELALCTWSNSECLIMDNDYALQFLSSECAAMEFPSRSVQEMWNEAIGELVTGRPLTQLASGTVV